MPVSLLKDRKPLGHWGHLKLHDVVGSIDILIGKDGFHVFNDHLAKKKLVQLQGKCQTLIQEIKEHT